MLRVFPFRAVLLSSCLALLPLDSYAAEDALQPRVEVNGRAGTKRSILMTEAWLPLAQDRDRVLYSDIRYMGDEFDNQEGNFGVGYRQINTDLNAVVGVHGWIDRRRTDNGSLLYQNTLGVELMGPKIEARVNAYIPLSGAKTLTQGTASNPYLAGTGLFYDTSGSLVEEGQSGFDAELGYRLPVLEKHMDSFRVYAGAYAFRGDVSKNVTGWRTRVAADINPAVQIGARFQHDEPRGVQGFIEATIRFPFTAKKAYQSSGLRARLDESPERDIDIVTGVAEAAPQKMNPVLNTTTGQQQRVLHVDNSNAQSGDGSKENPYNSLSAAEAAMQNYDVIYVHSGTGTTLNMDHGITISKTGVSLIGSGSDFYYDGSRFSGTTAYTPVNGTLIAAATTAPVITNVNVPANSNDTMVGNGITVTGDNTMISGVTINGAAFRGVYAVADNVSLNSFSVYNTTVTGSGSVGILTDVLNGGYIGTVTYSGNTSSDNISTVTQAHGMMVRTNGAGSEVGSYVATDNTIRNNAVLGMVVQSLGNSVGVGALDISRNTIAANNYGIFVDMQSASVNSAVIADNTISSVNGTYVSGIVINATRTSLSSAVASVNDLVVRNNTISDMTSANNALIYMTSNNGSTINATITGNELLNSRTGIRLGAAGEDGTINAQITHNIISGNTEPGILAVSASHALTNKEGQLNLMISDNQITSNTIGIRFLANGTTGTGSMKAVVERNLITGNGQGILVDNDALSSAVFNVDLGGGSLGSVGQNSIYGNTTYDVYVDLLPAGGGAGTQLMARNNWWGVSTGLAPGRRFLEGSSTLDAGNWLLTPP